MYLLIIWGIHRFARKRVGYRNDFCLNCNQNQVSEWWRAFHMGHLYWIPLIPLGTRHEWFCSACGSDPHARVASSQGFKRFVAGFFLLLTLFVVTLAVIATFNLAPDIAKPSDAPMTWAIALIPGAIAAATVWWATRTDGPTDLSAMLQQVPPLTSTQCRYCGSSMDKEGYCARCEVTHYPLEFA